MRTTILGAVTALLLSTVFVSCGGKGGGSTTPEASLVVTTTPANGKNLAAAPGPTFPLIVQITSVMPPKGVTISINATIDGSTAAAYYTFSGSSTTAINNYVITDTPSQQTCLVTITVTSNTLSTNVWTGSYTYAMK